MPPRRLSICQYSMTNSQTDTATRQRLTNIWSCVVDHLVAQPYIDTSYDLCRLSFRCHGKLSNVWAVIAGECATKLTSFTMSPVISVISVISEETLERACSWVWRGGCLRVQSSMLAICVRIDPRHVVTSTRLSHRPMIYIYIYIYIYYIVDGESNQSTDGQLYLPDLTLRVTRV